MKTQNLENLSVRTYWVQTSIGGQVNTSKIELHQLIYDDGSEITYSFMEIFDDILDLTINEAMQFRPSRDDLKSFGIITRIK